ncbi:MAG: glycosyltransferase family 39 protein [Actinobacteria bacterium]|nr:MAG: glycosyltransferase family 39 protein [Actinomycetota bacterium]
MTASTEGQPPAAVHPARWWPTGWRRTVLLVVVAVVARVLYWKLAIPGYHPISDAGQYSDLATHVAHGKGLVMDFPALAPHQSAFRPPVYPLLLGFWYFVFGSSVGAGQALSVITGVAVVLLTERLGRRLGGPLAGLVAGLAVAVYVPLIADDATLLAESLSMVLLAGTLLLLVDRRPVLAGLTSGLLILTRPSAQGFAVVAALWLWWTVGWRRALYFLGVIALLFAGWVIRNEVQLGSPVTFTSNGFNLAAIYSKPAQQHGDFVNPIYDPRFRDLRLIQFDEVRWNRSLTERGLDGLRDNPTYAFHVIDVNSRAWFEIFPNKGDSAERFDGRNISVRHWSLPEFYLFTIGGIAGLVVTWRQRHTILLIAVSLYFTAASLLLVAPPRVRAPFDLINCIGLGLLAAWWWQRRHGVSGESSSEDTTDSTVGASVATSAGSRR